MLPAAVNRLAGALSLLAIAALSAMPALAADTQCTVLADADTGRVLLQEGICDERVPPASTFKIPIALMGYDAGILQDAQNPTLPFKEGYADWIKSWRADTGPTVWMRDSVVWYSQQVTLSLGMARFAGYAAAFGYGNADVSGDAGKDNGLTRAWLSSSLRISPLEQVDFLTRLVKGELPVSAHAHEMTKAILPVANLPGGWTVRGKTGAAFASQANGKPDRNRPIGWYVGWAQKDGRTIVFARMKKHARRQELTPGFGARDAMLADLPAMLDGL